MTEKIVNTEMLAGAAAAESNLAREEADELSASLPEGHPLRAEVDRVKAELNGDLSGLPDNHPLLRMLKEAKSRYEQSVAEETEDAQAKAIEVKKAKKLDRAKARQKRIAHEEEQAEYRRTAATAVNQEIDSTLEAVRRLYEVMAEHEERLNMDPMSRARVGRLKRFLYAVERGLSDNRMGRV